MKLAQISQLIKHIFNGDNAFIALQYALPQHLLSRVVGRLASSTNPVVKNTFISQFVKQYHIDMSLAVQENPLAYATFNDFFTRAIKPQARPIDSTPNVVVSPADGAISQLGQIDGTAIFQAKGQSFDLVQLIGCRKLAEPFEGGSFATVYLSPKDYHRVHMPFAGMLTDTIYIPGELFSVNTATAKHVDGLFARNERMVCLFDVQINSKTTRMAVVLVGAMIVAGIETVATGKVKPTGKLEHKIHQMPLNKGAELGRFYLGSTTIVLFPKGVATWDDVLTEASPVQMGKTIGTI